MKTRTLTLAFVFFLASCAREEAAPPMQPTDAPVSVRPAEATEGQLTGEVFVVTRGGQSVKLGLVMVFAIPEEEVGKFIERKQADAARLTEEGERAIQATTTTLARNREALLVAEKEA